MIDLRIIHAKAVLTIFSVAPIRGFFPPSIMVLGTDLYKTSEVEYNGVLAPEFIVADPSRLIVRVPESQQGQRFESIRALAPISVSNPSAMLSFGLSMPIQTVSGLDRLVQAWLIVFMTTPGTDIFDPKSGGGAKALIGKTTGRKHESIAADLALAISRTKDQILSMQALRPGIPSSEKLLSSNLTGVSFNEQTSVLSATVDLRNMEGTVADISLG
jgi:hypothetical protein